MMFDRIEVGIIAALIAIAFICIGIRLDRRWKRDEMRELETLCNKFEQQAAKLEQQLINAQALYVAAINEADNWRKEHGAVIKQRNTVLSNYADLQRRYGEAIGAQTREVEIMRLN